MKYKHDFIFLNCDQKHKKIHIFARINLKDYLMVFKIIVVLIITIVNQIIMIKYVVFRLRLLMSDPERKNNNKKHHKTEFGVIKARVGQKLKSKFKTMRIKKKKLSIMNIILIAINQVL
ncbi:hypothetical protein BpHYR1_034959 [Brachionus plicatilis]|uniref:Uncharacterized protein n=1 Tax=Brachionus plicatilis TaxID=10195 RepID=A0A3M7PNQ4_BRAPC|nr:hypothetical protein BpHYR1_034959 [Brachionus plicatilis]